METYSYGIDFFSDEVLENAVHRLMRRVDDALIRHNPHTNIIDPFAAIFEASLLKISLDEWFPTEVTRQLNKTLSNAVGDFHQDLLGRLPGWESTGTSGGYYDLKSTKPFGVNQQLAIAEVKNKYNTLNSGGKEKIYDNFQNLRALPEYKNHTFYLIEIIQRQSSGDIEWQLSNRAARKDIRRIGAQQVYAETTGQGDAFFRLFNAVTRVLEEKYGFDQQSSQSISAAELFGKAYDRG
ncbi:Eco47II family restriction endonuclease [Corynebacterium kutscheri]|nr:Eco47II family restriction endonuclease [Corynebacterium kutscheri]